MTGELMEMLVAKLDFPDNWDVMTMIQQNYWIETQVALKRLQQRQQELHAKQEEQMHQAQEESLRAWKPCTSKFAVVFQIKAIVDVDAMCVCTLFAVAAC